MITHDESTNLEVILARQSAIRRELDRRQIALKVVSQDSRIPYSTLLTYFPADPLKRPAQIPGSAIYALAGHIPDDLMSLLLPDGFQVVRASEDINHDEIAEVMAQYLATKDKAHHVDSPEGREISRCEDSALDRKLTVVKSS